MISHYTPACLCDVAKQKKQSDLRQSGLYANNSQMSLIAYLENIDSDRKFMQTCPLRLDLLYFIGYNIRDIFPAILKCII